MHLKFTVFVLTSCFTASVVETRPFLLIEGAAAFMLGRHIANRLGSQMNQRMQTVQPAPQVMQPAPQVMQPAQPVMQSTSQSAGGLQTSSAMFQQSGLTPSPSMSLNPSMTPTTFQNREGLTFRVVNVPLYQALFGKRPIVLPVTFRAQQSPIEIQQPPRLTQSVSSSQLPNTQLQNNPLQNTQQLPQQPPPPAPTISFFPNTPPQTIPQNNPPQTITPQNNPPQTIAQNNPPQTLPQNNPLQTIPQNNPPQTIAPQNIQPQTIAPQNNPPQTIAQNNPPQTLPQNNPLQTIPQNNPPQTIAPQNIQPQTLAPQNNSPQHTPPQNIPPQNPYLPDPRNDPQDFKMFNQFANLRESTPQRFSEFFFDNDVKRYNYWYDVIYPNGVGSSLSNRPPLKFNHNPQVALSDLVGDSSKIPKDVLDAFMNIPTRNSRS